MSINDIAKFVEKMIHQAKNGGTFQYPVVNLTCSESVNNLIIAGLIKERLNSQSVIIPKKAVMAAPDIRGGLFALRTERAVEMGFESSLPLDIVNDYLDYLISSSR